MDSETPFKRPFALEETIIATPMPQATSTVDRKPSFPALDPLPVDSEKNTEDADYIRKEDYLRVSIDTLAKLREELALAGLNYKSPFEAPVISATNQPAVNTDPDSGVTSTRSSSLGLVDPKEMLNMDTSDFLTSNFRIPPGFEEKLTLTSVDSVKESAERPFESEEQRYEIRDFNFTTAFSLPVDKPEREPDEFTLLVDELQDTFDNERTMIREKALRTLNSTNRQTSLTADPAEHSSVSLIDLKSFNLKDNSVFPSVQQTEDQSGFSYIMRPSDLDRDEASCIRKNKDGFLTHTDMSLSGIELTGSGGSMFMPCGNSLLDELGPADPPKEPRPEANDTAVTVDWSISELLKDMSLMRMENSLFDETRASDISVPSLGTLAEIIANAPSDFNTHDLVNQILTADSSSKNNETSLITSFDSPMLGGIDTYTKNDLSPKKTPPDCSLREDSTFMSTFCPSMRNDNSIFGNIDSKSLKKFASEKLYEVVTIIACEIYVTINASGDCDIQANNSEVLAAVMGCDEVAGTKVLLIPIKIGTFTVVIAEKGIKEIKKHIIKVTSEQPMIELSSVDVDFGTLPDQCVGRKTLSIKSRNTIPVKLIQDWIGDKHFKLCESNVHKPTESVICIMPEEVISRDILFAAPELEHSSQQMNYQGELRLLVKSYENIKAEIIAGRVSLAGSVEKIKLQVKGTNLTHNYRANEKRKFLVISDNRIPVDIHIKIIPETDFIVSCDLHTLQPRSVFKFEITYTPTTSRPVNAQLCIRVMPSGPAFKVSLKGGASPEMETPLSVANIQSSTDSRSSSPNVTTPLSLESTSRFLVWGSVSRSLQVKRSCSLRNNSVHRERLNVTIIDANNSFFFEIEGEQKREMKITLDTMQTKEITVALNPTVLGPLRGSIEVTRMRNDNEKKIIGLMGFGGKGFIRMDSLFVDLATTDKRLQLLVLDNSLSTDFSLHNIGDGESYFLIFQSFMEATHIHALPSLGTIPAGSSVKVNVSFSGDPASIKAMLNRNKCLEIKLCTLLIVHGDEPTRLRLSRLYKKYVKKSDDPNVKHIMEELGRMIKAFPERKEFEETVSVFKDPLKSLHYLYHEGVFRSQIDVVVNRQVLEEADLDSTVQFMNLDNTLNDATSLTLTTLNNSDLNMTESNIMRPDNRIVPDSNVVRDIFKVKDASFATPLNRYTKAYRVDKRTEGTDKSNSLKQK